MTKRQVPRGPDDLKCPFHKKAMADVCHSCPLWVQLRGKNPQSTQEIDKWDCAIAFLPILTIENSQRQMQTAAAVNEMTAEVKKTDAQSSAAIAGLITMLNRAMDVPRAPSVIGNGHAETKLITSGD